MRLPQLKKSLAWANSIGKSIIKGQLNPADFKAIWIDLAGFVPTSKEMDLGMVIEGVDIVAEPLQTAGYVNWLSSDGSWIFDRPGGPGPTSSVSHRQLSQAEAYNSALSALIKKTNKKCECGKEKHGFAAHSDWCDLYERVIV